MPPSLGGVAGGPRGAGGRGSLCLHPSLCLPRAGTKAGFIGVVQLIKGVVSILFRFVFARCRPHAVHGVPLRAGAGRQACRGQCGSVRVAVWRRVAYGPTGADPQVPQPSQGGGGPPVAWQGGYRAGVPLASLQHPTGLGGAEGEEREGGGCRGSLSPSFGPLVLFSRRLRGGGLRVPAQTPPAAGCVAPRVPPCNEPCRGLSTSLSAGRGLGGRLPVGQSLPSRPPMCRAGGLGGGGL